LLCSHSGGDPQEDLAIFDYKLNAKVKFLKTSFYIFGYLLEPCIERFGNFFLYIFLIELWLIENLKNQLFSSFICQYISFWLYIASKKIKRLLLLLSRRAFGWEKSAWDEITSVPKSFNPSPDFLNPVLKTRRY